MIAAAFAEKNNKNLENEFAWEIWTQAVQSTAAVKLEDLKRNQNKTNHAQASSNSSPEGEVFYLDRQKQARDVQTALEEVGLGPNTVPAQSDQQWDWSGGKGSDTWWHRNASASSNGGKGKSKGHSDAQQHWNWQGDNWHSEANHGSGKYGGKGSSATNSSSHDRRNEAAGSMGGAGGVQSSFSYSVEIHSAKGDGGQWSVEKPGSFNKSAYGANAGASSSFYSQPPIRKPVQRTQHEEGGSGRNLNRWSRNQEDSSIPSTFRAAENWAQEGGGRNDYSAAMPIGSAGSSRKNQWSDDWNQWQPSLQGSKGARGKGPRM